MKLRNIWFSFFQGMLKSSFVWGYWGVPLRVGLSVTSPRRAVGFPLQSLTWVKGALPFGFIFRNMGCFLHSVRSRPLRQAVWPRADAEAERTNGTRSPVPLPGSSAVRRNFPCAVPFKRVPPLFVRQPPDRPFVS